MFEVGSRVEWCGVEGEVYGLTSGGELVCTFDMGGSSYYFHPDGKFAKWHKEPSLKLISRPKKRVKVYRHYYWCRHNNSFRFNSTSLTTPTFLTWDEYKEKYLDADQVLLHTEELFECDDPRGGE